ncbi:MAG TPA: energy-coupling factor transporter ATPase [Nordella sp.]|nr:energy-coupling factor transporter ATPase [Nordella sp.]
MHMGNLAATPGLADAPLIRFEKVSYAYPGNDRQVLKNIDLTIQRGEIIGVIGPTGAGKSTLCLALNGIVPQFFSGTFFGTVDVAGLDTIETPISQLAHLVGMVFEDPETQITATTVESEVAFALENLKVPTPEISRRVRDALAMVGLTGYETKHPANLSGGQKQRLSIASALALAPDIIVLDEPTSQLDPAASEDIFAILLRLKRESRTTVVIATHASEELAQIADRILLVSDGCIAAEGPPDQVFSASSMLREHRVRPPDITQSFEVIRRHAGVNDMVPLPVTLPAAVQAITALPPLELPASVVEQDRASRAFRAALSVEGLAYTYPDGTEALRGIDLTIGQGEFVGILGRNGSGKTTMVRHFLKLMAPTGGTVRVMGEDIAAMKVSDMARRIGYVSQNAHQQIFSDTVAGEVGFALSMMKRPKTEIDTAVEKSLAVMDLAWAAERHPISLSRGDRLRVAIAAVLALEPQILIFDEPTTGQDWRGSLAILDTLKVLNGLGKTVVLVTHHLYLLPGFTERLVVMNGGRIVLDGPVREVFYESATLKQAAIIPPQTVRFAEAVPALGELRPLGPRDLGTRLGLAAEALS